MSAASSSEQEDIEMHKSNRKINVDNTNEYLKGKISEEVVVKYLSLAETITLKL